MKIICILFLAVCISCNQPAAPNGDTTTAPPISVQTAQPEDSLTLKLRTAVTAIEKQELQMASSIKSMSIDSIRHDMTSLKDFYAAKKEELAKGMKYSTDKEKTSKALAYLDKMIAVSSAKPVLYKVSFHMNALLTNTTVYNEQHTKYLKDDLSELTVIFP